MTFMSVTNTCLDVLNGPGPLVWMKALLFTVEASIMKVGETEDALCFGEYTVSIASGHVSVGQNDVWVRRVWIHPRVRRSCRS